MKGRKAVGHILRKNCLLNRVIQGKIEGKMKVEVGGEEDVSSYWMTVRK
jgi:hypothetical protein